MSLTRWASTTAAMAGIAVALAVLSPGTDQVRQALTAPQALVDTAGADTLLVVVAAAAGWLCWAWGALGLLLTALSVLPGAAGRGAGLLLVVVLPAGARRLAAVAVGLSLTTGAAALATPTALPQAAAATLSSAAASMPAPFSVDWPAEWVGGAAPDWPTGPAAELPSAAGSGAQQRVVLRGDCLWDIAADWLAQQRPAAPVSDAEIVTAVHAWWQANASVIGPDPDLLLPGQVLHPPS